MAEEDAELKELVVQALESSGVLAKIRAQLRASVFLALDEANTLQKKKPLHNKEIQNFVNTRSGALSVHLIREFLNYFKFDSTLSVFESEISSGGHLSSSDCESLTETLNLKAADAIEGPLIDSVIAKYLNWHDTTSESNHEVSPSISPFLSKETEPVQNSVTPKLFLTDKDLNDEDGDRDPFFDDPMPKEDDNFSIKFLTSGDNGNSESKAKVVDKESDSLGNTPARDNDVMEKSGDKLAFTVETKHDTTFTISSLGSLKDAPPLFEPKGKLPPLKIDTGNVDKSFGIKPRELPDEDYDEDFQSSASVRSDQKTGTSEHSIEEEIEENFSGVVDDLLSNEGLSEGDDITTDHTISHISAAGADYLESVG